MFKSKPDRWRPKLIAVTGGTIASCARVRSYVLSPDARSVETAGSSTARKTEARAIRADIRGKRRRLCRRPRGPCRGVSGRPCRAVHRREAQQSPEGNLEQHGFAFGSWFAEEAQGPMTGRTSSTTTELGGNADGCVHALLVQGPQRKISSSRRSRPIMRPSVRPRGEKRQGRHHPAISREGTDVPTTMDVDRLSRDVERQNDRRFGCRYFRSPHSRPSLGGQAFRLRPGLPAAQSGKWARPTYPRTADEGI